MCSRAQLLQGNKLLLIVSNQAGDLLVFLDHLHAIDGSIRNDRCKYLHHDKIGRNLLVFDESRKMLMIVSSDKVGCLIFFKLGNNRVSHSFYYMFLNLMTHCVLELLAVQSL